MRIRPDPVASRPRRRCGNPYAQPSPIEMGVLQQAGLIVGLRNPVLGEYARQLLFELALYPPRVSSEGMMSIGVQLWLLERVEASLLSLMRDRCVSYADSKIILKEIDRGFRVAERQASKEGQGQ